MRSGIVGADAPNQFARPWLAWHECEMVAESAFALIPYPAAACLTLALPARGR